MSPKFSIITICCNEEKSIRKTCESVISQTFDSFEWIIIDGQSTDNTLIILQEYSSKITHLISEPDTGIYDAMNKGINLSKGDYLIFLNGGDYFFSKEALHKATIYPEADIMYGDIMLSQGKEKKHIKKLPDVLPPKFLLNNMLPHQSSFVRRSVIVKYGSYDTSFKIAGDYDLFVRLLYIHKASYFHIPHVIAVFKTDGISCDKSMRFLRKKESHRVRKKIPLYKYGFKSFKMECRIWLSKYLG